MSTVSVTPELRTRRFTLQLLARGSPKAAGQVVPVAKQQLSSSLHQVAWIRPADEESAGRAAAWPRPVQDGEWVDGESIVWRMRGGPFTGKRARRPTLPR